jgi:hypothetical protein
VKVKTLVDNVLRYGTKKGTVLEVTEEQAQHLLKLGVVEEVKDEKKPAKKAKEGDK